MKFKLGRAESSQVESRWVTLSQVELSWVVLSQQSPKELETGVVFSLEKKKVLTIHQNASF